MLYVFQDDVTGQVVDLPFPAGTAPKIGKVIQRDGRRLRRIFSGHLATAHIARITHGYPHRSRSIPKWLPGCPHAKNGDTILRSQAHERSVLDRIGYVRD